MVSHCLSVVCTSEREYWLIVTAEMGYQRRKRYLVNDAVPGESGIVDDDVYFAAAKLASLLDERVDVFVVKHVSSYCDGAATILVDLLGY